MSKSTSKLIKVYKGVYLKAICDKMWADGSTLTVKEIDAEIKLAAGFTFDSCTNPNVDIEDMQNLIIWAFQYGDQIGIFLDHLPSEGDDELDLDFERTEK